MLYVFHVDAGVMVTMDMNLTLQTVMSLKLAIEKKLKIPTDMIVLMISGGEVLQHENLVSSYGAGTDSSPIFLFTKPSMKDPFKQSNQYSSANFLSPIEELSSCTEWGSYPGPGGEMKSVAEMKSAVEMCCSLPPAVSTITTCAKVAQQFSESAQSLARSCEQLVHDQHLQHQGWAAVIANLEDIYNEFCDRSKNFKETFKKHKLKKEYYHQQMEILDQVLESLGKIPMLQSLQLNAEAHRFSAFDVFDEGVAERLPPHTSVRQSCSFDNKPYQDFGVDAFKLSEEEVFGEEKTKFQDAEGTEIMQDSNEGLTFKATSSSDSHEPTLLQWILAQGNKDALQDILDYCQKGLSLIDADPLKEREVELRQILEYANENGLKQIKGIEDRLYALDQLRSDVKKLERDQHSQAAALIQNRDRVSSTCDSSVLPTLVQSHRCHLENMLKNHQTLVDIKRRIAKSKDELSHILKARLEAVLTIENSMSVQDAHQMLSFQCFKRLARYFEVVEQLHRAPALFVRALAEVARRRTFSSVYTQWATSIASRLLIIYNEEVTRRQDFNELFRGHFLRTLFPGMGDMPPPFASQAPSVFDVRLPRINESDAKHVSEIFPELSKNIPECNMEPIVKYFQDQIALLEKDNETEAQTEIEKCNESELEIGEFEKLSRQSTTERLKIDISTICVPDTMAVSTITEDNMETYKLNVEKLQTFLIKLHELCKCNIILIREEIITLKQQIEAQTKFMIDQQREISMACERSNEMIAISFREETQRLIVDHEFQLSDMEKVLSDKDETIEALKLELVKMNQDYENEKVLLENEHQILKDLLQKTQQDVKNLEQKLAEAEVAKQKEIKDLHDKMLLDYKSEVESMRSRYRLVTLTNSDRSPSESSLEKIERTDVIEISSHNAIVMQTKENAEVEKEQAVKEVIDMYHTKMEEAIKEVVAKYEGEKQVTLRDTTRRLIAEKDRQIETLREREINLTRECTKYKETIQQLTDPETNDYDNLLKTQLASLENEKSVLKQQLQQVKKELELRIESEKKDEESSSESVQTVVRRSSHTPLGLVPGALSLSSCVAGNTVLLLWDPSHHNYTILQESPVMYFVHSDCLPALDLSLTVKNESERRLYGIGIVDSKEFCYAKKELNRYRMPRTSRFYRVRVRPSSVHPARAPAPLCCVSVRRNDWLRPMPLSLFTDRPIRKWLTYLHAPEIQKPVVASQPSTSAVEEVSRVTEVVTGTLINLESPEAAPGPSLLAGEDQLDSIEASAEWNMARLRQSSMSSVTDMECSVGRVACSSPLENASEESPTSTPPAPEPAP